MNNRICPALLIIGGFIAMLVIRAAEKSLAELESEVNQVLSDPDNVARRKRIAPVFQLADRYVAAGRTNQALSYYLKALEHQPWNLEGQLAVARLLDTAGDTNGARQKAELVWTRAETDALLVQSARLLGKTFAAQLPTQEPWPTEPCALALVPCGEGEAWLVLALREELQKWLGIPVIIRQMRLEMPKPDRDAVHLRADELRERIAKARTEVEFRALLRRLNVATNSLVRDEDVFTVAEAILNAEKNKEPARRFREELAYLRRLGPQWEGSGLLTHLRTAFPVRPGSGMGYLGITAMDLYSNDNRYVFAQAIPGGNCAIFSYRRFTSAVADDPPNRERLKERSLKQAISSVGLLFGVPRCTDPTCSRAYANSLDEHDAKQLKLYPQCQQGFVKRFGKKAD